VVRVEIGWAGGSDADWGSRHGRGLRRATALLLPGTALLRAVAAYVDAVSGSRAGEEGLRGGFVAGRWAMIGADPCVV